MIEVVFKKLNLFDSTSFETKKHIGINFTNLLSFVENFNNGSLSQKQNRLRQSFDA